MHTYTQLFVFIIFQKSVQEIQRKLYSMEYYFYLKISLFATIITVKSYSLKCIDANRIDFYNNLFNNDSYCNSETAVGRYHHLCRRSHS